MERAEAEREHYCASWSFDNGFGPADATRRIGMSLSIVGTLEFRLPIAYGRLGEPLPTTVMAIKHADLPATPRTRLKTLQTAIDSSIHPPGIARIQEQLP